MDDPTAMGLAIEQARAARTRTSPNPWVGAVVLDRHGELVGLGATEPPGSRHAEIVALDAARERADDAARDGTLVVTLEPCSHHGRTPPCTDAVLDAGIRRVVVGIADPDPHVAGSGLDRLRAAGVDVELDVRADDVAEQLAPYLHHRRTGRPYVVCKLAATLDGGTAAPDGTSRWITGEAARTDVHRLRAESDAILVGAGTVRADDPALTVRLVDGPDPRRVVLGRAPADARVHPCLEWTHDHHDDHAGPAGRDDRDGRDGLVELLEHLGAEGVLQLMVEGGATVVRSFHDAGLVDRYVLYVAPALFGGRDAAPLLTGPTAPTIAELWRGRLAAVRPIGDDVRIDVVAPTEAPTKKESH